MEIPVINSRRGTGNGRPAFVLADQRFLGAWQKARHDPGEGGWETDFMQLHRKKSGYIEIRTREDAYRLVRFILTESKRVNLNQKKKKRSKKCTEMKVR